ncbi:hypothetical protein CAUPRSCDRAFT_13094 [Caulochytrium protostelioides]|uniref:Uncharacterized protein n=1 Tax=Caulochytrium protostelioides TaxID=1555241 RepID=A0A4P9WVJ1_9FUNG|nr:hypothetical protein CAUPRSCDRAFT_13094 [Caulochytrium protostelioides]
MALATPTACQGRVPIRRLLLESEAAAAAASVSWTHAGVSSGRRQGPWTARAPSPRHNPFPAAHGALSIAGARSRASAWCASPPMMRAAIRRWGRCVRTMQPRRMKHGPGPSCEREMRARAVDPAASVDAVASDTAGAHGTAVVPDANADADADALDALDAPADGPPRVPLNLADSVRDRHAASVFCPLPLPLPLRCWGHRLK